MAARKSYQRYGKRMEKDGGNKFYNNTSPMSPNTVVLIRTGDGPYVSYNRYGTSMESFRNATATATATRTSKKKTNHNNNNNTLKADFHMIADRKIADRNKVCDRLRSYGNYFCDRLRSCDRDRRRSQKIEPCSI